MFGMLDYRAYKLFWLLNLPLRLALRIIYFILIAIAIWIGIWTGYQPPLERIIVAYVAYEGISFVFGILWVVLITLPVDKIFFWIVDVIPARGENTEQANAIVRKGPIVWLSYKMWNHIDEWTFEDTDAFASSLIGARAFSLKRERRSEGE
jgi:hypothetical protein